MTLYEELVEPQTLVRVFLLLVHFVLVHLVTLYLVNVLYVVFVLCVCLGDHLVQALPFKIDNNNNFSSN